MTHLRSFLVAVLALCLAVFPVGMSRASVPGPVAAFGGLAATVHAQGGHDHAGHGRGDQAAHSHAHSTAASAAQAFGADLPEVERAAYRDVDVDGCGGHAKHGGGSPCCGFGCHVYAPLEPFVVAAPIGRRLARVHLQDEQLDGGQAFPIERPPRQV